MTGQRVAAPLPATGGELKAVLEAERRGSPFLLFRDAEGEQILHVLERATRALTLGRRATNDLVFDWDDEVSRVHAELEWVAGEWTISDEGLSRNGTLLNGDRLVGRRRLRDGDQIAIGTTSIVFRQPIEGKSVATAGQDSDRPAARLTDTQHRIVVALSRPYGDGGFASPATNQQIAAEVFLSVDAVKNHLRVLFQRFELTELPQNQKRASLVELAFRWGYVSERDL